MLEEPYFWKLRREVLEDISITVPIFLKKLGVRQIIAPIKTINSGYWASFDDFNAILYPFVEGQNAFKAALTREQ